MSLELLPVLLVPGPTLHAGLSLLVRGLYGSFLSSLTMPSVSPESCVGFPQLPELTFCVAGLMCTCLGSWGPPSALRGLYALVSTYQPTLYVTGLVCPSLGSLGLHSLPQGLCALERFVCLSTLSILGLPSVLWGFYGLLSFP